MKNQLFALIAILFSLVSVDAYASINTLNFDVYYDHVWVQGDPAYDYSLQGVYAGSFSMQIDLEGVQNTLLNTPSIGLGKNYYFDVQILNLASGLDTLDLIDTIQIATSTSVKFGYGKIHCTLSGLGYIDMMDSLTSMYKGDSDTFVGIVSRPAYVNYVIMSLFDLGTSYSLMQNNNDGKVTYFTAELVSITPNVVPIPPVPIPGSLLLFMSGLGVLGFGRKIKRWFGVA